MKKKQNGESGQSADIGELRRELAEAREEARRFRAILEEMPGLAWIKDSDHRLIYMNPAFERYFSIDRSDWRGKAAGDIFPSNVAETIVANDREVLASQNTVKVIESVGTGPDQKHFLSFKFPLSDTGGKYLAGVTIDLTQQVSTEAALREQVTSLERSTAVRDRLLSVIAHDVRAPLATLSQFAELLDSEADSLSVSELKENLSHVRSSADNTQKIITQLLQWVRSQDQRLEPRFQAVDPAKIFANSWELLIDAARNKAIKFHNEIDPALRLVGDRNMFATAARNLLSNAVKFTENGGSISVRDEINDDGCVITVNDTGVGMPQKVIDQILGDGVLRSTRGTNREMGSGLGLGLVKDFIKKQNGTFSIRSTEHRGTSVGIGLPLIRKNEDLYQLMYQSEAAAEMDLLRFQQLSREFAEKNHDNLVTGLLIFANGTFLQLIEGHRLIVSSLYETIGKDQRNRNCIKLFEGPATQRLFPDRSMQTYVPAKGGEEEIRTFSAFLEERCINVDDDVCRDLLSYYRSMISRQ